MASITRIVGGILVVVGLGGYLATDGAHVTALLPGVLGLAILVLGIVAGRVDDARHPIHAALVLALLGGLGALPRVAGIADGGAAAIASLVTVVVSLGYVGFGVRSFVAARKAREQVG